MLTDYPEYNLKYENDEIRTKWKKIVDIKEQVAKKLEEARAEKVIGHSLNAKVILYAENDEYDFLMKNSELLKTVFIISELNIEKNERANETKLGIKVENAPGEKCERCWMYKEDVGKDKEYPTICHRCAEVMRKI